MINYLTVTILVIPLLSVIGSFCQTPSELGAQHLTTSESSISINNPLNKTNLEINLTERMDNLSKDKKTLLVFYTLPNGNSLE